MLRLSSSKEFLTSFLLLCVYFSFGQSTVVFDSAKVEDVNTDGFADLVTIYLSGGVDDATVSLNDFKVDGNVPKYFVTGEQANDGVLIFGLSSKTISEDTYVVSYTQGSLTDITGGALLVASSSAIFSVDGIGPFLSLNTLEIFSTAPRTATLQGSFADISGVDATTFQFSFSDPASLSNDVVISFPAVALDNATKVWSLSLNNTAFAASLYDVTITASDINGNQTEVFFEDALSVLDANNSGVIIVNSSLGFGTAGMDVVCSGATSSVIDFTIQERRRDDIVAGEDLTFYIDLPTGFYFDATSTPTFSTTLAFTNTDIVSSEISIINNDTTLRISLNVEGEQFIDDFSVENVMIFNDLSLPPISASSFEDALAEIDSLAVIRDGSATIVGLQDGDVVWELRNATQRAPFMRILGSMSRIVTFKQGDLLRYHQNLENVTYIEPSLPMGLQSTLFGGNGYFNSLGNSTDPTQSAGNRERAWSGERDYHYYTSSAHYTRPNVRPEASVFLAGTYNPFSPAIALDNLHYNVNLTDSLDGFSYDSVGIYEINTYTTLSNAPFCVSDTATYYVGVFDSWGTFTKNTVVSTVEFEEASSVQSTLDFNVEDSTLTLFVEYPVGGWSIVFTGPGLTLRKDSVVSASGVIKNYVASIQFDATTDGIDNTNIIQANMVAPDGDSFLAFQYTINVLTQQESVFVENNVSLSNIGYAYYNPFPINRQGVVYRQGCTNRVDTVIASNIDPFFVADSVYVTNYTQNPTGIVLTQDIHFGRLQRGYQRFYGVDSVEYPTSEVGGAANTITRYEIDLFSDGFQQYYLKITEPVIFDIAMQTVKAEVVTVAPGTTNYLFRSSSLQETAFHNNIIIHAAPIGNILGFENGFCLADPAFTISATTENTELGGISERVIEATVGYVLIDSIDLITSSPTIDSDTFHIANNNFNPLDPDQDGVNNSPTTYMLIWETLPVTDGACTDKDTVLFEIFPAPSKPSLVVDQVSNELLYAAGGYDIIRDKYIFDFCSFSEVPTIQITDFDVGMDTLIWTNRTTGVVFQTTIADTISGEEIFGVATPSGDIELEVGVKVKPNNPAGCVSEETIILFTVFNEQVTPQLMNAQNIGENDYLFEFCANQGEVILLPSDRIIPSLLLEDTRGRANIEARSYLKIMNARLDWIDTITYGEILNINLSDVFADGSNRYGIDNTASMVANGVIEDTLFIQAVLADSTFIDASGNFVGCSSDIITLRTKIYTRPAKPTFIEFENASTDAFMKNDTIQYYMCQNTEIPFLIAILPNEEVPGEIQLEYQWFKEDKTTPVLTSDRLGRQIFAQDLVNSGFDNTVATTTTYYVRAVNSLNSNFINCESEFVQVDITVFPDPEIIQIDAPSKDDNYFVTDNIGIDWEIFSFCVDSNDGFPDTVQFISSLMTPYDGAHEQIFEFYGGSSPEDAFNSDVRVAFGDTVTAGDLNINGHKNDDAFFAIVSRTEIFEGFPSCVSDTTYIKIEVATISKPQFRVDGIVAEEVSNIYFFDETDTPVDSLTFTIRDINGNEVANYKSTDKSTWNYTFATPGVYECTMSLKPIVSACTQTVTRKMRILEKIIIGEDETFLEDFNTNDGGWFAEFQSDNGQLGSYLSSYARDTSWQYGVKLGESAWHTGLVGTYTGGALAYLYSPSFDLSKINEPLAAISFNGYKSFDDEKDGVSMQYSIDNGATWVNIGDYQPSDLIAFSGLNWYNENAIPTSPGQHNVGFGESNLDFNIEKIGWTQSNQQSINQTDDAWTLRIHALPLVGTLGNNLRFRFALSVSGIPEDVKSGSGFSLDNFSIYPLEKNVLVEQFSSLLSTSSRTANKNLDIEGKGANIINYYTRFDNTEALIDPIGKRNFIDPHARSTYYGVVGAPESALDGQVFKYDGVLGWNARTVNRKQLDPLQFSSPGVTLTYDNTTKLLNINTNFVHLGESDDYDVSVFLAIVENKVLISDIINSEVAINGVEPPIGSYDRNDTLFNVFRIMLPSVEGERFVGTLGTDQSLPLDVSWEVSSIYSLSNIRVVAFIQDNVTKRIYHSVAKDLNEDVENILGVGQKVNFSVYPNPVSKNITVKLPTQMVDKETKVELFNLSGQRVIDHHSEGVQKVPLSVSHLKNGIHIVKISNGEISLYKKVLIIH